MIELQPDQLLLGGLPYTLILATVMAVGIYYFIHRTNACGSGSRGAFKMDSFERRRRRELLAKAAEVRVSSSKSREDYSAVDGTERNHPQSRKSQLICGVAGLSSNTENEAENAGFCVVTAPHDENCMSSSNGDCMRDLSRTCKPASQNGVYVASSTSSSLETVRSRDSLDMTVLNNAPTSNHGVAATATGASPTAISTQDDYNALSDAFIDQLTLQSSHHQNKPLTLTDLSGSSNEKNSVAGEIGSTETMNNISSDKRTKTSHLTNSSMSFNENNCLSGGMTHTEAQDSTSSDKQTKIPHLTLSMASSEKDGLYGENSNTENCNNSKVCCHQASSNEMCTKEDIDNIASLVQNDFCSDKIATNYDQAQQQAPTNSIAIYLMLTSSPSSPRIKLIISAEATATELRKAAAEVASVPPKEARLIFRGRLIVDSTKCCMRDYGVEDGSVLHLVGKPKDSNATETCFGDDSKNNSNEYSIHGSPIDLHRDTSDDSNRDNESSNEAAYRSVHEAAAIGDLHTLRAAATENPHLLFEFDSNGWTPLHEAIRNGQADVIAFLAQESEAAGRDDFVNDAGPLALAIEHHGEDHPITNRLRELVGRFVSNNAEIDLSLHEAAARGDMHTLCAAALQSPHLLYELDSNGWTPLHEAARAGHEEVVSFLVQEAERAGVADVAIVNSVSNFGNGWSPLALAIEYHGEDHPVTHTLRQLGGQVLYPRL